MRRGERDMFDLGLGYDEDTADLIDVVSALEQDLAMEQGTLIRHLTKVLTKRRLFEEFRRNHDVRFR